MHRRAGTHSKLDQEVRAGDLLIIWPRCVQRLINGLPMTTDFWDLRLFLGCVSAIAGMLALLHGIINSRQATTDFRNQEIKLWLFLGYISLIVGTLALLRGIMFALADGQPFHYPRSYLIFWSLPSLVVAIHLFLGRNMRVLSWALISFLIFWAFSTVSDYSDGRIKFQYWHQGEVFCVACDNSSGALFLASILFGLGALVVLVVRKRQGRPELSTVRFLIGAATPFLLLVYVVFQVLSY
jgi:hypothetical protein